MRGFTKLLSFSVLAFGLSVSTQTFASVQCKNVFVEAKKTAWSAIFEQDGYIFPKGISRSEVRDGYMQLSYESEYLFSESGPLLKDYAPDESVVPRQEWLSMSDDARIAWIKNRFQAKPEHAASAGLKRIVDLDFMPDELIVDSTGNLEIVLKPFDTYAEWEHAVDTIVSRYGEGSQQAMLSKPRQAAFHKDSSGSPKQAVSEHLGWLVYTNLRDTIQKVGSGYERYLANPSSLTVQSFDHPFLGPMIKLKRDQLQSYIFANAYEGHYDTASKMFVRKSDASFKYTGGPAYRPDIAGPDRFAWEIRNAHKSLKDLKFKVKRDIMAHKMGLQKYQGFSHVPAFDSIQTFDSLPYKLRKTLSTLFPSKADPRFEYTYEEQRSLETYRNFAFPMQDFSLLTSLLKDHSKDTATLNDQVAQARSVYLSDLNLIATQLEQKQITVQTGKAKVMGSLAKFVVESGLYEAFNQKAISLGHE